MTEPHTDEHHQQEPRRIFYGRRLSPLIKPWIACFIVTAGVYAFETAMPAFHDVVKLIYFIIAVIFVIVTGRALRVRGGARRVSERRRSERRRGGPGS